MIKHRAYAQKIQAMLGGVATHPACGVPGGMSKPIREEERTLRAALPGEASCDKMNMTC